MLGVNAYSVVGLIVIIIIVQWLLYPMFEHNELKRRRNENNRAKDSYFTKGRIIHDFSSLGNDSDESIDISLVIPAFNEEKRLPIMLDETILFLEEWTKELQLSYEIIIVDDESTDKTVEVALEYYEKKNYPINVLRLGENHGKGGAVKQGVERAKGDYILMVDADGATDITELSVLYKEIKNMQVINGLDVGVVLGSRAHLQKNSIATRAFYRTILMRGFHVLVMLLCTKNIKDTQCGFKLFTKSAAKVLFKSLHLERWAFDIEIIYLAEVLHIPMKEVAVIWHEVEGSKLIQNKFDIVKTSLSMARDIFFVKFAYTFGLWKITP